MAIKDKDQVGTGIRPLVVDELGLHASPPSPVFPPTTNFNAYIASIGTTETHLVINRPISVLSNLTIPSNVFIQAQIKDAFAIATGVTLTFTNPVGFDAGRFRVFSGLGTVAGLRAWLPEWIGVVGDGITDDAPAIVKLFNAMRALGGVVDFKRKTYSMSYGVWIPQETTIFLSGSTIKATTTFCQGTIPTGGTSRAMLWVGGSLTASATLASDYANISIIGDGATIDGNALNQVGTVGVEIPGYSGFGIESTPSPIVANLFRVKNIVVKDLTITHPIWYAGNIEGPDNVLFENVRFLYAGTNGCSIKSGRNITFRKCEASFTRGPNIIDSSYGAGFWHEPNSTWQVMENIVHIDCFASYNYMAGFRLWNPGVDAGAEVYAIRCKSYKNSWDTATQAYRSSVDSAGFHANVPTSYTQKYHIEMADCTALEEYQSGFKIQRGGGLQTNTLFRIVNPTTLHCLQDDADGYERAHIAVVGTGVGSPASAGRVEIINPTVIAPPANTAGYGIGVLYSQDVFVTNPSFRGTFTYKGIYANNPTNRFTSGVPNAAVDLGSDNGTGIIGDFTKLVKAIRIASFDQTAEPTEILTNELVIWQNDNNILTGIFINDDGTKRYIPMIDAYGTANQLVKYNPNGDGIKPSAVTIDESNIMSGVARVNVNGASDNVSTPLSCVGNIAAKSGSINAYGVGGPGETNSERILLIHDGATADVRSLAGGSGTLRTLRLVVNTTANIICQTNGDVTLGRNAIFSSSSRGVDMASGCIIRSGTGSPEGVLTAPIGSMWLRSDGGAGTSHYIKESGAGNTGWVAK